jgi:hypothetical protein
MIQSHIVELGILQSDRNSTSKMPGYEIWIQKVYE